jgi:hypothetical protein
MRLDRKSTACQAKLLMEFRRRDIGAGCDPVDVPRKAGQVVERGIESVAVEKTDISPSGYVLVRDPRDDLLHQLLIEWRFVQHLLRFG